MATSDTKPADTVYAGDIDSGAAWEMLTREPDAMLVDIRTQAEWAFVGVPDLAGLGKKAVFVPWQVFPTMQLNPNFIETLETQGVTSDKTVLLICRSGSRSRDAATALAAKGYARAYNVADGFEGPLDTARHRGTEEGWKAKGLAWIQD